MPVVLGGGIGGLTAAHYLLKLRGTLNAPIKVLESSNRLGGWIKSENRDGFVLESGPRTLRPRGEAGLNTLALIEDLKLENKVKPIFSSDPAARNRMIYVNGNLCLLPNDFKSVTSVRPPFSKSLLSWVFHDLFTGRSKEPLNDETIYSFAERRFGKEVADYLISAMICGICAGDAKEISVKFLMKDIFAREQKYGGVVRGAILNSLFGKSIKPKIESNLAKRAQAERWNIYSLDGGLELLPKTLVSELKEKGVDFELKQEAKEIVFDDGKVIVNMDNGKQIETEHLISSIPSNRLARLLKNQHPDLAQELKSIPFVDVGVVNLQYNKSDLLEQDGFGFLVPPCENLPILGVIFDSCCFKTEGNTMLTVMLGGRWFSDFFGPDPPEQELLDVAKRYVKQILKIRQSPDLYRVNILNKCIPQYIVGHVDRVQNIKRYITDKKLPLTLCGASYDGVGVNDVILSARNAVHELKK